MAIKITCEKCSVVFEVPEQMAGRKGRCKCGHVFIINRPEPAEATLITHKKEEKSPSNSIDRTIKTDSASKKKDVDKSVPPAVTVKLDEKKQSDSISGAKKGEMKTIGHYEILHEIGRGGMGVVYKARDPKLNRTVALKVMLAGEDASEEQIKRFHKEAESIAKLNHPNVVPVYDIGQEGNSYYFTMDFVDGEPLDRVILDGKLKYKESLEIMHKVAVAMEYCHKNGVIHRDLKPANIILDSENAPHIMDFGLAKNTEVEETKLTRSGVIMGTPSYLSPEQAINAKDSDRRTDIWAMGVILYEMLCGKLPFTGNTIIDVITRVTKDDPLPPKKLSRMVNNDANTVIMKCLEKDRDRRYSTSRDLARDINALINREPIAARPPSIIRQTIRVVKKRRATSVALIAVAIMAVGFFIGYRHYLAASMRPLIMEALDSLTPGEEGITAEQRAELMKFAESSIGLDILAGEITSESDIHKWGAIIICGEVAPGEYKDSIITAFIDTRSPHVEDVAWKYLKKGLPVETIDKMISKKDGIVNLAIAQEIFVGYVMKFGIKRLSQFDTANWPEGLLKLHSDILGSEGALTYLPQLMKAEEEYEQNRLVNMLASNPAWQAVTEAGFIEFIQLDKSEGPISTAIKKLGVWNCKAAVPALIKLFKEHKNANVRVSAGEAMFIIRAREALPVFVEALDDPAPRVRVTAVAAMKFYKNKSAIPKLIEMLRSDKLDYVKINVADSLGHLKDDSAIEPLDSVFRNDKSIEVKAACFDALAIIRGYNTNDEMIYAIKTLYSLTLIPQHVNMQANNRGVVDVLASELVAYLKTDFQSDSAINVIVFLEDNKIANAADVIAEAMQNSNNKNVVKAAIKYLAKLDKREYTTQITTVAKTNPDDLVRMDACNVLLNWDIEEAYPLAGELLRTVTDNHAPRDMLMLLKKKPRDKILPVFIEAIKTRDTNSLMQILRVFLEALEEDSIPYVLGKWEEHQHIGNLLNEVAQALKLRKSPKYIPKLIEMLKKDISKPMNIKIVNVLAAWGAKEAVPLILDFYEKKEAFNEDDKLGVLTGLKKINDERAAPLYIKSLKVKNLRIIGIVSEALADLDYKDAIPDIIETFDSNPTLGGLKAIAAFKDKRALPVLIKSLDVPNSRNLYNNGDLCSALSEITGEKFGNNPAKWKKWWQENKSKFE